MKYSIKYPIKYIPRKLSKKDKKKQKREINKSKILYKKGKYYTRKKLKSFTSKKSKHIKNAEKIYNLNKLKIDKNLINKTGCSKNALMKIFKKGLGAYYSSGSRPNQTPHSWAYARLASSITAGKSSAVDFKILESGCKKTSKALMLAKKARKKYKHGTKKVPKINLITYSKNNKGLSISKIQK